MSLNVQFCCIPVVIHDVLFISLGAEQSCAHEVRIQPYYTWRGLPILHYVLKLDPQTWQEKLVASTFCDTLQKHIYLLSQLIIYPGRQFD